MLEATITADTFFGARHGLETLSQLIVFDDVRNRIEIPNQVSITDGPVYPYRGVLLDTSRNFVDKATIDLANYRRNGNVEAEYPPLAYRGLP